MMIFLLLLTIFSVGKATDPTPKCLPNMIPYYNDSNICYLFVADAKTFDEAESFCNQSGGHLAPVFNQFANFFITERAASAFRNADNFWIGAKSYNVNGGSVWLWTWHKSYLFYSDWDHGQPKQNTCAVVDKNTAMWSSDDCDKSKPFVCQIPAVIDVCDPEWPYFKGPNQDGMCYRYMAQSNVTQMDAQNICLKQNSNLASVHSEEENAFLNRIFTYGYIGPWYVDGVYFGLRYENYQWKWLDGTKVDYTNWGPDRPLDPVNRTCGYFYPDEEPNWIRKWENYIPTFRLNRFVCEKKPRLVFVAEDL